MRRAPESAAVLKKLERVDAQVASGSATGEKRLALLRQQAQLGDKRDALAEKARRGQ